MAYVIKENEEGKQTVIDTNTGKQVVGYYNRVYQEGAIEGKSDYIVVKGYYGEAIFDINGKQISDWFEAVLPSGLVNGESIFYIAKREKDGKQAIFDKDGNQISDWFDAIYSYGFVKGEGEFYMVKDSLKYAIFNKEGEMVERWICCDDDYNIMYKKLYDLINEENKRIKKSKKGKYNRRKRYA